MKKYLLFAVIFVILFFIFQVLSGLLLTQMNTPNIEEAWNMSGSLSQEEVITGNNSSLLFTVFIALLSATIAYFIPKKFIRNN